MSKVKLSPLVNKNNTEQRHEVLSRCGCGGTVDIDGMSLIQFCHACGSMWLLDGRPLEGDYSKINWCCLPDQEKI